MSDADPSNDSASTDLDGLKVMVIDDSRTIRKSAETMLSREGCEVITADDGL